MPAAVLAANSSSGAQQPAQEARDSYKARRYALKFDPPCIFLEYEDTSSKRRVRAVKLNGVQASVDPDRLTRKVIRSFPRKLEPSSVKYDQVRKLVVRLLEFLSHAPPPNGATPHQQPAPARGAAGGAANGKAAAPLAAAEPGTSSGSLSAPLPTLSPRPGLDPKSPGGRLAAGSHNGGTGPHMRSVDSTLSRFSTSTGGSGSSSSGDSDDGDAGDRRGRRRGGDGGGDGSKDDDLLSALDELTREIGGGYGGGLTLRAGMSGASSEACSRESSFSFRDRPSIVPPASSRTAGGGGGGLLSPSVLDGVSPAAGGGGGAGGKSRFAAEAEKLVIGLEVTDDLDLNKVTDVELRAAKQAMEADFNRHRLKPGDPGFEYDKQADFGPPTQANDWDDSGDEGADEPSEDPEVDWTEIAKHVSKTNGAATPISHAASSSARGLGGSSGELSSPTRGPKAPDSPYDSRDWP